MKKLQVIEIFVGISVILGTSQAYALDNIIRPYQSARAAGMGNVRLTTGLYDENFFGNPARVTQNPKFRVTILDPMIEVNKNGVSNMSTLISSPESERVERLGDTAGTNNHLRIQTTFPSVYIPPKQDGGKLGFAFGFITSTQADLDIHRYYSLDPQGITDIGPAVTVGRKFLENDALSVGITTHLMYRLATKTGYTFVDYVRGVSLAPSRSGSQGTMLDFDVGGTYDLPWTLWDFKFTTALAINNLLGGRYNIGMRPVASIVNKPNPQSRAIGFGGAARRATLGPFSDAVFALEITDIGNNPDGSMFRTVHFGGEVHWGVLMPRLGFNQGYIAAGLGVDLKFFTLDLATYGEEMSLNAGGLQDRRFALRLAFQI